MRRLATFVPPLLVGLLAVPFIVRQNSWWEWNNAFWLLERQAEHVKAHGVPTLFINNLSGAFNPFFAYYAGFTFSVLAYPAVLLGAWPVFAGSIVLAIVAGYLGIWWTARNLGLSAQLAVLPALTFATTPYVLSEMYGRGAWAELIAVNAVAVLLGGFTALLWHPERRGAGSFAAVVAAGAVVVGTHNPTVLMSAILLPLLLLVVLPLRPAGRSAIVAPLARGIGAAGLGVGLAAGWLIPNLSFGPSTWIAQPGTNDREFLNMHGQLALSNLLSPLPNIPDEFANRWVYDQAPATALAWVLVAFVLAFAIRRRALRAAAVAATGIVALGLALLLLIVDPHWWLHFPRLIKTVQFPFRLIPYLAMLVALGTVVGLMGLRGRVRLGMVGLLVALVALQAGAGVWLVVNSQASGSIPMVPAHPKDLPVNAEPTSFANPDILVALQFRVLKQPDGGRPNRQPMNMDIKNLVTDDSGDFDAVGRVGDRLLVPVVWSQFVRVTGDAQIAGRDGNGMAMIEVTRTDAEGHWHATAEFAHPWQLVLGRILSVLSALVLAALGVLTLVRWRRRRRGKQAPAVVEAPAERRPAVGV